MKTRTGTVYFTKEPTIGMVTVRIPRYGDLVWGEYEFEQLFRQKGYYYAPVNRRATHDTEFQAIVDKIFGIFRITLPPITPITPITTP